MDSFEISKQFSRQKDWPDNSEVLLDFSSDGDSGGRGYWALQDAFEGVQVFGGTGSGKSSGSGQALARAFLQSNLGGLVLTAKTDEAGEWMRLAAEEERSQDLVVVCSRSGHEFNFLRYELNRSGVGAGHTESLVNLFCAVLESAEKRQGQGGGSDPYWNRALRQLLRNAIDLAVLAMEDVDLASLYQIITSAPTSRAEARDEEWQKGSACFVLLEQLESRQLTGDQAEDFKLVKTYFLSEFAGLANETRSAVVSTFTSMADCFMRGILRGLFCRGQNFSPEDCFEGKIIVFDLPVKEFNELGQFAQVLFKFVWQRAVERRIPPGISRENAQETIRPVFLFADESQFFVNSYDALFQSTARSSRACTVYLTQNLPTYFSAFGGMSGKSDAESFLGNLQTKIAHANGDPTTNQWIADSIGRTRQVQVSGSMSEGGTGRGGSNFGQTAGGNLVFEYQVQPTEFTTLATGGPDHNFETEAVIFQGGRSWEGAQGKHRNFIKHRFPQRYEG
jgi:hypothetical protein